MKGRGGGYLRRAGEGGTRTGKGSPRTGEGGSEELGKAGGREVTE